MTCVWIDLLFFDGVLYNVAFDVCGLGLAYPMRTVIGLLFGLKTPREVQAKKYI